MAFCNKASSLIGHTSLRNTVSRQASPFSQMLGHIRSFSSRRLFVGGLSFVTDDQQLKEAFSCFGTVTYARVIVDRETKKSRGFGFVNFENEEDADSAKSGLDGQDLHGRALRISFSTDDRRPTRFGGGFGNQGNGSNVAGSEGQG